MNRTSLTMVIPLVLLATLATTPIMITEDAFASRYQRHTSGNLNQAASISNSCLNPVSNSNTNDNMISNGNCGGTVSQQGRSGQTSNPTTVQNANPKIEVQRSTTTPAPGLGDTPTTGTVSLSVSTSDGSPPNTWQFNTNIDNVSPREFFGGQTIVTPATFQLLLESQPIEGSASLSTGAPCSTVNSVTINVPLPSAGQTISCSIQITVSG